MSNGFRTGPLSRLPNQRRVKHGGKQRYKCCTTACYHTTFIRAYSDRGYLPKVKQPIADMAVNGSGVRDTARVIHISPTTVIEE